MAYLPVLVTVLLAGTVIYDIALFAAARRAGTPTPLDFYRGMEPRHVLLGVGTITASFVTATLVTTAFVLTTGGASGPMVSVAVTEEWVSTVLLLNSALVIALVAMIGPALGGLLVGLFTGLPGRKRSALSITLRSAAAFLLAAAGAGTGTALMLGLYAVTVMMVYKTTEHAKHAEIEANFEAALRSALPDEEVAPGTTLTQKTGSQTAVTEMVQHAVIDKVNRVVAVSALTLAGAMFLRQLLVVLG